MPETRLMPVPDALVGERIDAALSRILGLSRSRCSDLILEGHIRVNGNPASKSLKLGGSDLLEIRKFLSLPLLVWIFSMTTMTSSL